MSLGQTPPLQIQYQKQNKLCFMKQKKKLSYCRIQSQDREIISHKLEKTSTNYIPNQGLVQRMFKELLQLNSKDITKIVTKQLFFYVKLVSCNLAIFIISSRNFHFFRIFYLNNHATVKKQFNFFLCYLCIFYFPILLHYLGFQVRS